MKSPPVISRPSLASLLLPWTLVGLLAVSMPIGAQQLLSLEFDRSYSIEELERFTAKLWEGSEPPEFRYPVDAYHLYYGSSYPDGREAEVYAQLFIPQVESEQLEQVYAFGSGSTGISDRCKPSREHILGIHWGYYRAHSLSHAAMGSVALMPDYLGFGDPDQLQLYMVVEAEAQVFLDGLVAIYPALSRIGHHLEPNQLAHFVAGFSQGGHAALAVADHRQVLAPDVRLDGVIGYGPTTDLQDLFREFPDVAPMALFTFQTLYGPDSIPLDRIFPPRFSQTLATDVQRMCVGAMASYYPLDPLALFSYDFSSALIADRLEDSFPNTARILEENRSGRILHDIPVLIAQGGNDIVVFEPTQRKRIDEMKQLGLGVDLLYYPDARHDTRQVSFSQVRQWMADRSISYRALEAMRIRQ